MQALDLPIRQYGTVEEIHRHIHAALGRGLPELAPALCSHDGTFVVAGSGPSLPQFVDALREEFSRGRPVCAINHAHDFLIEQGMEPTFFLTLDPRPRAGHHLRFVCEKTIYLLASRVHPEMFDRLKDHKVMLWHSWAAQDEAESIWESRKSFLLGGGTTSGMRAVTVGYVLGFRKFVLYGMDSCLAPDGMTKRFNGDKSGQTVNVQVGRYVGAEESCDPNARWFTCNHAMAQQGNDFIHAYRDMPDVSFEVKGDGLLAAIVEEMKCMGLRT
jgi:uncharacterized Rossmann fold enzyme